MVIWNTLEAGIDIRPVFWKKMYVFLLLNRVLFSFCESFSNESVSTTASPQKALSHGVVEVQDQIQVQDIKKIVIKYTGDTYAKYFLSRF